MPWAGPGYRSDLADECGRGQNSLRRRLEALGWSRLALPSPDDQSGTIAHQRAVVEIQGWSTPALATERGFGSLPRGGRKSADRLRLGTAQHPALPQRPDPFLAIPQLAQHLLAMLARRDAAAARPRQTGGELARTGQLTQRALRARDLGDQLAGSDLRMLQRLAKGQHRFHADIQLRKQRPALGQAAPFDLQGELAPDRLLVLGSLRQPARRQLRSAQRLAEGLQELRLQAADRQPATITRAVVVIEAA